MEKYKRSLSENQIPAFWRCSPVRSKIHAYFLTGPLKVVFFAAQCASCSRRCMGVGLSTLYSHGWKILLRSGSCGKEQSGSSTS